jgi:hypothetical protein
MRLPPIAAKTRPQAERQEVTLTQPQDAAEREADHIADRIASDVVAPVRPIAASAAAGRQDGSVSVGPAPRAGFARELASAGPGRSLSSAERAFFEPRLGSDLSSVRLHDGALAGALSRSIGARAFARGNDIYFGAGQFRPATTEGRRLLAHELVHTRQPHSARVIARKTLTDLSETIRRTLKISRVAPDQSNVDTWIKNYFNPKSGIRVNQILPTEFGDEITDGNQQTGLRSIATELVSISGANVTPATATEPERRTNTDPEKWPLAPNSVLDLALDLRGQNGPHAIFRFVRYTDGTTEKLLVETTKVLAPAPTAQPAASAGKAGEQPSAQKAQQPAQQPANAPAAPAATYTGDVKVGSVTVKISDSFGDTRGKVIADAVSLLPDPIRAKADGLPIEYGGSGKGPGGQNGHYDPNKDVVTLWGDMFANSPQRLGEASSTAYQIVHELGHVIDLRPLMAAQLARDKATDRKTELESEMRKVETKFIDPNDPLGGIEDMSKDPRVVAEKARIQAEIDKVKKAIEQHEKDMRSAKSVAGSEVGSDTESMLTDFAKAIAQDGVTARRDAKKRNKAIEAQNEAARKAAQQAGSPAPADRPLEKTLSGGVSLYAETDIEEAFAENFAYYILDEALLKAIRPKTHAFFARKYPKTVPTTP